MPCTCNFHDCTLRSRSCPFHFVKCVVFAVVWTTRAHDDKCSVVSSYLQAADTNLTPGYLDYVLSA